jgi:hypothetical protein
MGVGGQRHAPAALSPGITRYSLYRRLGRPQGRSGWVLKITHPPELDSRTVQLFLEEPSVLRLAKNAPHFMEPEVLFDFTSSRHLSLSWARSIQSMPSPYIYLGSTLISPSPLRLGLSSDLFLSGLSTHVSHSLPNWSCLIWSPVEYFMINTNHWTPHYTILF